MPFETIASDVGAVETARTVVVTDASAWADLWAELQRARVSPAPLPGIDFGRKMILGVFLGARSSGCYSVHIERVTLTGEKMIVEYRESIPPPLVGCATVITFPSHLVAVDRSAFPVEFAKLADAF